MARQQTGGRSKAVLFLVASLVAAGAVSLAVYQTLQRFKAEADHAREERADLVEVVVAARDLYMGLPIIPEEDLIVKKVLPDTVPAEFVFGDPSELLNRTPRERIYQGEIVRDERLASQQEGIGLNAIITPGRRAMTIETDTESGLAGLLQPNNYVDVIVTIKPDDTTATNAKWVTETILQTVRVLAVGSQLSRRAAEEEDSKSAKKKAASNTRRERPSVTLELTLEEAEKLALASSKGDLHLVLRSDVDIVQQETGSPVTTASLMGLTNSRVGQVLKPTYTGRPSSSKPDPVTTSAEVVLGDNTTVTTFGEDGKKLEDSKKKNR